MYVVFVLEMKRNSEKKLIKRVLEDRLGSKIGENFCTIDNVAKFLEVN